MHAMAAMPVGLTDALPLLLVEGARVPSALHCREQYAQQLVELDAVVRRAEATALDLTSSTDRLFSGG